MKRNFRLVESRPKADAYRGPYQEIAVYVRDLLKCDCAFVAVPDKDSIRIEALASQGTLDCEGVPSDIPLLKDFGPTVIDDARVIAVPVSSGSDVIAVLIGYSTKPGTFSATDLEKLMEYANVAAGVLGASAGDESAAKTSFTSEELLHVSRLVSIGELSACFAHEINNPLTLIRGHLRFIEETLTEDHPLRVNFEVIARASRRIEEMSKRILDFSRKRPRRTEPADISDVVADALRLVQPYVRSKFVDVKVHFEQVPALNLDRGQMVQTLVNLFQNAVDAMADVERRVLSVVGRIENKQVRIVVSDTGLGIKPANVSRIFEPFFTTKGERGTGLGLYIAKQIVEEHQGTINVQTSDRGTSFVITLPL